ncbi:unnamed protein product [Aspergillus oryzae]|nr:unnamed protein product [Aspergillus oryzae]
MPLSENTALRLAGNAFGTIILGFGINALIRPDHALTFFEWTPPTVTADRQLVNSLMYVYGVRDIYMGLSVYVASIFGTPESLGWTLLAFSAVAFADGAICWSWEHGKWGHWSYAPIVALIGTALSGLLD